MELDKKDICKIIDAEPNRIKHVKLERFVKEEYAESAYRVKVDDLETKYTGVFKIKHFACDRDLSL